VAGINRTVLLGETGTGKELLTHAIHAAGRRAARPFVGVNIAEASLATRPRTGHRSAAPTAPA
jgi:transcriptional regulator with PAS, ATPase and Fis domain